MLKNGNRAFRESMHIIHFVLSSIEFIEHREKEGQNKYGYL